MVVRDLSQYCLKGLSYVFVVAVMVTAISGCVTPPPKSDDWPKQLPEKSFYLEQYAADRDNQQVQSQEDYLKWVKRFYLGWPFYPKGWEWLICL